MPGKYQRYGLCVHALCGGMLTVAVMALAVLALPCPLHADDGHGTGGSGSGGFGNGAPVVEVEPLSPAWYIETIRRLLHAGRARESYQMARLAADRHPRSADVRLAAAYAAVASGRCSLAKRHLAQLPDGGMTSWQLRRRDMLLAGCDGPWQRRVVTDIITGYRPSLSDRARQAEMRLEPGSRLHGVCARLRGLCDPAGSFTLGGRRDSGIDLWVQLQLKHLYRAGTRWDLDLSPVLFRRHPSRAGHRGQGVMLRAEARRYLQRGMRLHLLAETGVAHFRQGDRRLAFDQSHRRAGIGLAIPHNASLSSHIGHSRRWVRSGWLDLRGRRTDYRLDILPRADESHSAGFRAGFRAGLWAGFWAGAGVDRVGQSGPGLLAGSRARILQTGLRLRIRLLTVVLRQERRRERFTESLAYLAAPHRARTRIDGIDLIPDLSGKTNLKVAVSLDHRKISSPDISRPGSLKTLKFTFSYTFDPRP